MHIPIGHGADFRMCVLLATFTLACSAASAQDVEIYPRLRDGDEFRLEMIRIRENSSRPQQDGRSKTTVEVRVVSVTPEAITLDWTPGETTFENPVVAQDPLMRAASEVAGDLRFRITLTPDGEYSGLANEAEIAPKLQAGVDIIMRDLSAKIPADQRKSFDGFISQVLSPAMLIATATREAQMYFALHGVTLNVGESIEAEIDQPNPLGGNALPAKFRVRTESATTDSAVLSTTVAYDAAALVQITRTLVEKSGLPAPAEELAKLPPFEMSDEGRYVFDRAFGLMREVVVKRLINSGSVRRFDGWEIRLVKGPKR